MSERTSLVVQWLRICLPMHKTQVPSLIWEDSTCCEVITTEASVPQLLSPHSRAHALQHKPPLSTTKESLSTATKTQNSQELKKKKEEEYLTYLDVDTCTSGQEI